jgi:hypothetical protein
MPLPNVWAAEATSVPSRSRWMNQTRKAQRLRQTTMRHFPTVTARVGVRASDLRPGFSPVATGGAASLQEAAAVRAQRRVAVPVPVRHLSPSTAQHSSPNCPMLRPLSTPRVASPSWRHAFSACADEVAPRKCQGRDLLVARVGERRDRIRRPDKGGPRRLAPQARAPRPD